MQPGDDFNQNHVTTAGLQQGARLSDLAPETDSDGTIFDDSESSCHTLTTIQSDQVADYFRSFHGFQYESDESVPRVFAVNGSFDKIDVIVHIMLRLARGGKNVPPVVEEMLQSGGVSGSGGTPRVLEVVTNSGVWAQEMVDIYPSVRIVSVDTKPLVAHKPHARIDYEVYDLGAGIMEPDSSFDLVYSKHAERATKDVNHLLQELHRVLKPNGYLLIDILPAELYEGDPAVPFHSAPRYAEGMMLFRAVWEKQGLDVSVWDDLGSRLDAAHPHWENHDSHRSDSPSDSAHPVRGFHSIDRQTELLPLGMWLTSEEGKILGGLTRVLGQLIWRNFLPTMLVSGKEEAEAEAFIEGIMQELADIDRYKAYNKCQFWCARKIEHV